LMRPITSKASGGATAHWRRFQRLAFPTPSHKYHMSLYQHPKRRVTVFGSL
jgi:hypothetical protein